MSIFIRRTGALYSISFRAQAMYIAGANLDVARSATKLALHEPLL